AHQQKRTSYLAFITTQLWNPHHVSEGRGSAHSTCKKVLLCGSGELGKGKSGTDLLFPIIRS
ncbi:MAG: hypothetical protein ACI9U1_002121, partial [Porticoccaceae bacterium]